MHIFSPLEQFEIVPVLRITGDLFTITNSTVFGFLAVSATSFFLYLVTTRPTIIPNRWQSLAESL
jgi:F0F1-type ATP synthase membrane subunit a